MDQTSTGMALPHLDGITHHFVDLPGLRMHVAEAGQGDAVLLLHGFPQHWWEWRGVIPGLAAHYRVICPDLRGAGWTGVPRDGYDREHLLGDVVALLDGLGIDRVHLLTHDWGALVGYHLSLAHPERVRSHLSLAVPHPYIRFHPGMLLVSWRLWFQPVIVTPWLGPRLLSHGQQRLIRYLLRGGAYRPDAFTDEDLEIFLAPLREPARARAGAALYRGFILREARQIMSGKLRGTRLHTPTRAGWGTKDPSMRAEFLDGYADHTDDMRLVAFENAGHFIADDQPAAVVDEALKLFRTAT